jgi:very-short-patch-repair endonuclease
MEWNKEAYQYLHGDNWTVLRFWSKEIKNNLDVRVRMIADEF